MDGEGSGASGYRISVLAYNSGFGAGVAGLRFPGV